MLDHFVKGFSGLWKELFPDCRIEDFEATDEDWKKWLGSDYKGSISCKEVKDKLEFDIQKRIDEYVEILDEIRPKVESERTAVAVLQEACKDRRSELIKSQDKKPRDNLATEKQKRLMRELKIRYPGDISKVEASKLIDQYFENE